MKKLLLACLAVLMLFGSITLPENTVSAAEYKTLKIKGTFYNAEAKKAIKLVNKERKELGLQTLKTDADLMKTAQQRAAEIAVNFDYDHLRPDGTSFRTVGNKVYIEIICAIYGGADGAVEIWRDSPPHYNVYTTGAYNTAGAACFSQGGLQYWVMHFNVNNLNPLKSIPDTETKTMKVKSLKKDVKFVVDYNYLCAGNKSDIYVLGVNKGLNQRAYKIEGLNLKYTSTNTKVVRVNNAGRMYGIRKGTAKIKITGDITKTINLELESDYKINYHLNGGTLDKYSAREYLYYTTLRKPTKEGYFFKGWYGDKNYKQKITELWFGDYSDVYVKWSKVKVNDMKNVYLSKASNKMTIKYSPIDKADGYQIYYATNSKFTDAKKVLIEKGSYKTPTLTKGKKYYVKMRAYRLDSAGKRVYGKFSAVKSIGI